MKKIERLDYNTSVYPPHIPRLQTVIEKVQELIDAHNELAKIVGLLLKRDEENCLEKAKAELLETHTVKEEPTTPEKNRDWQSDREDYRNGKPLDKPMSYEVTCGRCEKSIKHSCGRV